MSTELPLVAICMATFEPDLALAARQIASLQAQTHERWRCLISDDGSSSERLEALRELIAGDERFELDQGSERLGVYRNFERALKLAPAEAEFVALADQDDSWYPEKLAALLAACRGARLAYSDMRIVEEGGRVSSETFWRGRANNHTNLASLLLANTVTGAASLFRRDLLERALPFPALPGEPMHDHWLACVALASGEIAYVDRPLYDYVQHGGAARGHAAAVRGRSAARRLRGGLGGLPEYGRRSYEAHLLPSASCAAEIESRLGSAPAPGKARALRRVARLQHWPEPTVWLALRWPRRFWGRSETNDVELSLLVAIWWHRLATLRERFRTGRGR